MEFASLFTQPEIVKYQEISSTQQFKKILLVRLKSSTLSQLVFSLYGYATNKEWDVAKKCALLNISLNTIDNLVKSHSKQDFVELLKKLTQLAGRRDGNYKQLFSELDIEDIRNYLKKSILPSFELYRIIFDRHTHFKLQTTQSQIVKQVAQHEISSGTAVEVDSITILQDFIGVRQPKQQKKEVKKK